MSTDVVENCRIGTDAAGISNEGNRFSGINISSPNNTIRGNLISGNRYAGIDVCCATGNQIVGNCIGTNAAGTAAIPNDLNSSGRGITMGFGGGVTIGGTNAAARNVISGNSGPGIYLDGNTGGGLAATILGNYIGVTKDGMAGLGNDGNGIELNTAANITIGGSAAEGNVIAGNTNAGVLVGETIMARGNSVQGSVNSQQKVATVNDANQPKETLTVKVNGGDSATVGGVTVSGLTVDSAGNVTASITVTCGPPPPPTKTFTLTVKDNGGLSASAKLRVKLAPNPKPKLSYNDQTVAVGGSLTVNPATGPSDNGTFTIEVDKVKPETGITAAVHPTTGVVSITGVTRAGSYKIDIDITDNCDQKDSAKFKVVVTSSALATSKAVKNDFDGDSKSDLVDWNPERGEWRIRRSSDDELQVEQFGQQGDDRLVGRGGFQRCASHRRLRRRRSNDVQNSGRTAYKPATARWP